MGLNVVVTDLVPPWRNVDHDVHDNNCKNSLMVLFIFMSLNYFIDDVSFFLYSVEKTDICNQLNHGDTTSNITMRSDVPNALSVCSF